MPDLYNRAWSIQVATDEQITKWESPATPEDYALSVAFKCTKTADLKPNDAEIKIYNLSEKSRNFIQKNANIEVSAGYKGNVGLIFKGVVQFVDNKHDGVQWESTITARDGALQWRDIGVTVAFEKGSPVETVIQKLISQVTKAPEVTGPYSVVNQGIVGSLAISPSVLYPKAVPSTAKQGTTPRKAASNGPAQRATAQALQSGLKLERGRILRGVAMRQLEIFCKSYGLKAIWGDQKLSVVPANQAVDGEIISLTPDSGLIGIPEPIEGGGFRFTSLLRHEFRLGCDFNVESKTCNGIYRVKRIEIDAERDSQNWYSTLEAVPIGA